MMIVMQQERKRELLALLATGVNREFVMSNHDELFALYMGGGTDDGKRKSWAERAAEELKALENVDWSKEFAVVPDLAEETQAWLESRDKGGLATALSLSPDEKLALRAAQGRSMQNLVPPTHN